MIWTVKNERIFRKAEKCVPGQREKARMNSKSPNTHGELIGVKDYRGSYNQVEAFHVVW